MKSIFLFLLMVFFVPVILAQDELQKIYDTEKAFERAAAEKGINQAFIEYAAPDGICFFSGYPNNCREYWKAQPASSAYLARNLAFIDVAANGALAYSTGTSVFRPKGKDDSDAYYGHYLSVWQRQPNGNYLAVLDIGISHDKPAEPETKWTSPKNASRESNEKKSSAADSSVAFYQTAESRGMSKAYAEFLADDAQIFRAGKFPVRGKQNILTELKKEKAAIRFAKRTVFVGAADLAYVTNGYALTKKGGATETGNFVQIWKLRGERWQIVADLFLPTPPEKK